MINAEIMTRLLRGSRPVKKEFETFSETITEDLDQPEGGEEKPEDVPMSKAYKEK